MTAKLKPGTICPTCGHRRGKTKAQLQREWRARQRAKGLKA